MSIADDITREVAFTDYSISNDYRIEVVVSMHMGKPLAIIRMPEYPNRATGFPDDITEPDLLRSYAHAMLAAADEMEKMNDAIRPD